MRTFDDYKRYIEEHLTGSLPEVNRHAELLSESMTYSLTAGGKRLRPVLLLAACEMAGGDIDDALPYAAAIEFIHTYSLIHDDLPAMDNDELRRGKPTNHVVYGAGIATLAGDGLLSAAFQVMSDDMVFHLEKGDEISGRIHAEQEIAAGAGVQGMVAGQTADIKADSGEVDADLLHYIHLNKTAALIKAAVRAGLYLGGSDEDMLDSMSIYADDIGTAFQIDDDILDIKSTTEELGKPVGSDEENHKLTYVSLYGVDAAVKEIHRLTAEACGKAAPYDKDGFFTGLARELESRTR